MRLLTFLPALTLLLAFLCLTGTYADPHATNKPKLPSDTAHITTSTSAKPPTETDAAENTLLLTGKSSIDEVSPEENARNDWECGSRDMQEKSVEREVNPGGNSARIIQDEVGMWRELGPDEGMPVGAHVRLDMSGSGKNYIKIEENVVEVDTAEASGNAPNSRASNFTKAAPSEQSDESFVGGESGVVNSGEEAEFEEIERVLKELPEPDKRFAEAAGLRQKDPVAYEKAVRRLWQKRQEELAKAFEELADEAQILREHLHVLVAHNSSEADVLHSLAELEYMVQNLDTAQDFAALNGLEVVMMKLMDESARTRTQAAYVIGSACKLDHSLQSKARELGVLALLQDQLEKTWNVNSQEAKTECAKVLYALSALIRGSPDNQEEMASTPFVSILQDIVDTPMEDIDRRVQTKAVTLLDDMLQESCHSPASNPDIIVVPVGDSQEKPEADTDCLSPLAKLIDPLRLCNRIQESLNALVTTDDEQVGSLVGYIEKLSSLHRSAGCAKGQNTA